jgi:hypothetical protein
VAKGGQPSFDGVSNPLIPEPVIMPKNSNEKWFENQKQVTESSGTLFILNCPSVISIVWPFSLTF